MLDNWGTVIPVTYNGHTMTIYCDQKLGKVIQQFCRKAQSEGYTSIPSLGIYSRRRIAGSKRWSSHAWRKGIDLATTNLEEGNKWCEWLREIGAQLGIHLTICWQDKHHKDHVHCNVPYNSLITPPKNL